MSAVEFRNGIRAAIANPQLQAALDANAKRRGSGRTAAFASLPDWPERRRRAQAVRAEVVQNLDEVVRQFTENARRGGMQVHRAADAAEARRLVIDIAEASAGQRTEASQWRPLLFAKSKSMVSEEIELNAELERRGHRVVETDLGEYIVQLRGERPAHIITPAVHLLRGQVGRLFEERLGLTYTEDIGDLTAAARLALREVFLGADIGVSGVNFGVAETGGICIITNEGNGRMVTTVPRVHIALMGMERLVPTLEDLALMLSLLPRSATGQKISVYTQLIHGPRGDGEVDGAIERHVIILDNGRTRLWESSLRESLYCIRCGACLNACPVFREIGGHAYVDAHGTPAPYPGPIGSVISPGLIGLAQFGHLAQASSLCGACKDACPVDIDLPSMLTRVRAGAPEAYPENGGIALSPIVRGMLRAYAWFAARPRWFEVVQRAAALGGRLVMPKSKMMRMPAFTGWGLSKDLPAPAERPFRDIWVSSGSAPDLHAAQPHDNARAMSAMEGRPGPENEAEQAEDPVARLRRELELLGAQAIVSSHEDIGRMLEELLGSRRTLRVLAWDRIEGIDLQRLQAAGIALVHHPDPDVKMGISGCLCAVAETGTLVLTSGGGRPLAASLLPEVHIAIVHARQVIPTLEEALRLPEVRGAGATVMISGPSRTADIEMTLTIGVHGPKELIVYLVQ